MKLHGTEVYNYVESNNIIQSIIFRAVSYSIANNSLAKAINFCVSTISVLCFRLRVTHEVPQRNVVIHTLLQPLGNPCEFAY